MLESNSMRFIMLIGSLTVVSIGFLLTKEHHPEILESIENYFFYKTQKY